MKENACFFTKKKDKNEIIIEYKSSGILLNMAMDEYTKERERANTLDNKAGFFITLIVAVATIFVPIIPFPQLIRVFQNDDACTQKCISIVFLIGILVAFAFLLIAFRNLYKSYKLTDYYRANLDCINEEKNHVAPNDQLYKGLCDHYKTIVYYNINANNEKCGLINIGIKYCGIGFMILLIAAIGLIITIGG